MKTRFLPAFSCPTWVIFRVLLFTGLLVQGGQEAAAGSYSKDFATNVAP
jgi:hypothetical protein